MPSLPVSAGAVNPPRIAPTAAAPPGQAGQQRRRPEEAARVKAERQCPGRREQHAAQRRAGERLADGEAHLQVAVRLGQLPGRHQVRQYRLGGVAEDDLGRTEQERQQHQQRDVRLAHQHQDRAHRDGQALGHLGATHQHAPIVTVDDDASWQRQHQPGHERGGGYERDQPRVPGQGDG
jgi:hypothetical protein